MASSSFNKCYPIRDDREIVELKILIWFFCRHSASICGFLWDAHGFSFPQMSYDGVEGGGEQR